MYIRTDDDRFQITFTDISYFEIERQLTVGRNLAGYNLNVKVRDDTLLLAFYRTFEEAEEARDKIIREFGKDDVFDAKTMKWVCS